MGGEPEGAADRVRPANLDKPPEMWRARRVGTVLA